MALDVNQAFYDEKTSQLDARREIRDAAIAAEADQVAYLDRKVADGSMRKTGPDTYMATKGWDRGEVFTVGRNAAGVAEVVPQHGLDTTTGRAALYASTPAWHGLGAVIPGGTTDITDVLTLGGIDFDVAKSPALFEWDDDVHTMDGGYVTVRTDTGAALGMVGAKYTPIQNTQIFTFLQDLVDSDEIVWESAGATRGGRRVFVSLRAPQAMVVDRGGLNDTVELFLVVVNSHDGYSKASALVTPWRPVCGNTERFAVRDAVNRWGIRHTSGALSRIDEARRSLGLTVRYASAFEAEETALARTEMTIDQFRAVVADLWPLEQDAPKRTTTIAEQRTERLTGMYAAETQRAGRTAYAAERAVTDYLDHVAPRRPGRTMTEEIARATALIEGADDEIKTRAHQRLMLVGAR